MWISPDATEWERVPLPWDEGHYLQLNNAVATGDRVVLGAFTWFEPSLLVAQAVAEHYPHLRGDLREYPDREPVIVLTAPPFIPVLVVDPEEIGLTTSDVSYSSRSVDRLTLIGTDGGHRWKRVVAAEDDDTWINPAFKGPDGMIWGRNDSGALFRSADGLTWEPVDADLPASTTAWESGVIGVESYGGRGTPKLQTSSDLFSWEDFPIPDVLPPTRSGANHWEPVLAAGGGGVALAVRTTESSFESRDPLRIERDGYTLVAGSTGLFLLRGAIPVVQDWEPDSDLWVPARMSEDGTNVIFSDPATRTDLVTFTLEELEETFKRWNGPGTVVVENDRHVLFFSPDAETWTIQDLSAIATAPGSTSIAVGTESILMITSDFWSAKVWVGKLPEAP